jgi:hypothetical protein
MGLFGTTLTRAIDRGLKPNGDLKEELSKLHDYSIQSAKDAHAIVKALRNLPMVKKSEWKSCVFSLVSLFQDIESAEVPAFRIMHHDGIQALLGLYDRLLKELDDDHVNDLLFILKIFSLYGSPDGCERIIDAAKAQIGSDGYLWSSILKYCVADLPPCRKVIRELSNLIPKGFIAISLLDAANDALLGGETIDHPFNSTNGLSRIRAWLEDDEPKHFSYAVRATVALAFIDIEGRDDLLALAMDHIDVGVQLEAAWAAARLGRRAGVSLLAQYCLDISHSESACRYLKELELEHAIPKSALEPEFQARSAFASWLAHPNELAKSPDEVDVVETRELLWPGEDQPKQFWLLRYRLIDKSGFEKHQSGIGLVGSMTWCFFSDDFERRPPEDCYAIHCAWEMEGLDLIEQIEVSKQAEYAHLLSKLSGEGYQNCKVVRVAEISPKLKQSNRLVTLVEAMVANEPGWVAVGSGRLSWYPAKQFRADQTTSGILRIHLGRQLLGFNDASDREKYLQVVEEELDCEHVVQVFEHLLGELKTGDTNRINFLLNRDRAIQQHLDDYLVAKVAISSATRDEVFAKVYEHILTAASRLSEAQQREVYDSFSILGQGFKEYTEILDRLDKRQQIKELVGTFAPYWNHNLGYSCLGNAAFRAKDWELAEIYFLKLKEGMKSYVRCEEMSLLASIWHSRSETEQAKSLILECLTGTLSEIKESKYESDRKIFADEYKFHYQMLLSLYSDAEETRIQHNLPDDPMEWYSSTIDI